VEVCVFRDPWGGGAALQSESARRFVFEVNALPSWELGYRYPELRHSHATRAKLQDLERFCLRAADAVLTVSEVTGRALASLGVAPERITTVPNAASPLFFEAEPGTSPLPELAEGRWIGYVGSLHAWQGVEVALEAWSLVEGELPEVRLLVVHGGRRRPLARLRRRAARRGARLEGRVVFAHSLAHEQLAPTMASLELTLAPLVETARNTVQGCCPVKIVESMASGTPVVASDLRVTRALVTSGEDGLLVPPGDPRAMALAIRRLLRDAGLRERLGSAARRKARERFGWARAHAAMEPVFRGRPTPEGQA
jgi:glycosyltransferase involved in cell wall biosynthesis